MKNLFKCIVPAAFILAASCTQEINTESIPNNAKRYNLTIDQPTKTELSGTGSKRHVNWSEGDEIKYYTVSKQASSASATIVIDGSNAYVEIPRGRTDEFINAVYGAAQLKSSTSTESIMYITSPVKDAQRFTSFAEAHVCAAFSDDIENPELKFHNVAPVFTFTSSAAVSKVVFRGNNDEIIAGGSNGDLKISYSGGALTTEASSTGSKSVTIATNGEESDFYFAVLPVNFANGITVDCYDADNALLFSKKAGGPINTVSGSGTVKVLNLGSAKDWIDSAPPTAIDLGLSVKWASFNVGATKPEEYGDYFAWGEIAPKSEYKWANYQFGNGKNGPFSKYVLDAEYGTVDHKLVLDLEDDAAHANWGDDWRMPSKEEVEELKNTSNCTWTWTTKNGVPGYRVTSKKSGFTGNSIFLPANGMYSGASLSDDGAVGNYWSSTVSDSYPYYAISPYFSSSYIKIDNCYRYFGLGVRPVYGAVVPVSSITIPETLTLLVGKSSSLTATIQPSNATYRKLTWATSDESIATVDASGKVTSVSPGTVTITAYSASGTVSATCVVGSNQLVQSITLDKTEIGMYVGDEPVKLTATVLPEENTDKSLTWTSSNSSVATVDADGNVTAVSNGTATITVKTSDGSGLSASCVVTVKRHVESVSLNKAELTIYTGKSETLSATVLPSNASDKSVTWTSSDESIATVNENGLVTGKSAGLATITVTTNDGGLTAMCEVTVMEPNYNGHEYVDLGLPSGIKWATFNIGATKPEEYGDYFAWGETEPKSNYSWSTYNWCNGDYNKLTKYCTNSSYWDSSSSMDNKTVLDPEDDAAHVNWGGSWRMPTEAEWRELRTQCTSWTWTTQNGVNGRKVTGPNGNSIFLPAAGYRRGTNLSNAGSDGGYWSSSLYTDNPRSAFLVSFYSGYVKWYYYDRYLGQSVRPVSE